MAKHPGENDSPEDYMRLGKGSMAAGPLREAVVRYTARELGVPTVIARLNTPYGNMITTAEHAIAMMFAVARQLPEARSSRAAVGR